MVTRAGILLRGIVFLAGGSLAWLWWNGGENAALNAKAAPLSNAAPPAATWQSNGSIIIPVLRPGGTAEPMVLTPVQSRPPAALSAQREVTNSIQARQVRTSTPPASVTAPKGPFDERVLAVQAALVARAISSGPLDGMMGSQTRAALRVFQQQEGLPQTGHLDDVTLERLAPGQPSYTNYVVTEGDLAQLQPIGSTWLGKSQQSSLAYETVLELIAEKTCSNPKLLRWLNGQVNWPNPSPGTEIKVVLVGYPEPNAKAACIRIHLGERKMQVWDAETNLLAHFPCSIAARVDKRPLGEELHIVALAPNPNYTFDPAVFPESAEAQQLGRKLILPPGPNNPVGTVWLSLDKPGYGIHGTPKPEEVGRTESHGCFRLANWNAEYLLKLIAVGTPVFVEP